MTKFGSLAIFTLILMLSYVHLWAQMGSQRYMDERLDEFSDSLKSSEYPYMFPAFGDNVMEKGFDIPFPHGVMLNIVQSKQDLLIEDLAVGINGSELVDLSDIVRFESTDVRATTVNIRPDTWVFPFLNVYGLLGYVESETDVVVGLPINIAALSETDGPYYGFGALLAGGVGPLWFSADYNMVWVNTKVLDKASRARINGIRLGHTFVFRKKPEKNVSFWIGAMFQKLASDTRGTVLLSDVIDIPERKGELINDLNEWFDGLNPIQQDIFNGVYNTLLEYLSEERDVSIDYRLGKRLANPWSMAIGAQYQFNKRLQLRTEYNFLGSREQLLLSLNYRFGIKGPNFLSKEE